MATRIAHWGFIIFLSLVGLWLTLGGGALVYLGGSFYYILAGLATLAVVWYLIKRNPRARQIWGGILAVTILWTLYEAGLDFLSVLPRIAAWLGVGLWFFTPWYKATLEPAETETLTDQKWWLTGPTLVAAAFLVIAAFPNYERGGTGTDRAIAEADPITDWRHYGNTTGGTRFAQLEDINTETVKGLKEVWRYRTGVEDDFKTTPLSVNGMLYLCAAENILIAIDDATGEEVWRYASGAKAPAEHQYARTCRSASYHEAAPDYAGQCQKRIVTGTVDARLIAVDALTGEKCTEFGNNGEVDLRKGLSPHLPDQYYITSPPLVADDNLVVGGLVLDNQDLGLPSGVVRAFNAITGEFAWAWDVGRPGYHGEPPEGEYYTPGTPNVWSVMSYDEELDLIYAPTGNASPDYFGGPRRPFDDEWSSAVVAIEGATGEARWKYQTVHHDVWDYDVPAQPVLVDVEVDGESIPSVAVPTKRGDIFLLDRRDGTPVHEIEERPVPQDPPEGEYLAPTQPFSPLPDFHPFRHEKDMWGLTPLDQLVCRIEFQTMRYEGLFTPPIPGGGTLIFPNNFGGFNWGSVSVDADNGLLVAAPMMLANRIILVSPEQVSEAGPRAALLLGKDHPAVRLDENAPVVTDPGPPDANDPYDHRRIGFYGLTIPFMSRLGTQVPCFEPPWSQIAVIDLNTKELLWRRPVGSMKQSGPFGIRSGLPFQVGTAVRAGTLTTRGGLTFISSAMDSTIRAFNVRTGKVEWAADLPGSSQSTPMSYVSEKTGKQYIVVTVPNPSWIFPRDPATGKYIDSKSVKDGQGGYVIAYALED